LTAALLSSSHGLPGTAILLQAYPTCINSHTPTSQMSSLILTEAQPWHLFSWYCFQSHQTSQTCWLFWFSFNFCSFCLVQKYCVQPRRRY